MLNPASILATILSQSFQTQAVKFGGTILCSW